MYEVRLCLNNQSWKIFRRFSEFEALHSTLKIQYPELGTKIKFPPKKLWPNAAFLRQRRADLEVRAGGGGGGVGELT